MPRENLDHIEMIGKKINRLLILGLEIKKKYKRNIKEIKQFANANAIVEKLFLLSHL